MANLEDTVLSVVQDFMNNNVLFTALDVSNAVKQTLPNTRHREIRDEVRKLYSTHIEPNGWARTPISVELKDGSTAEALLYHLLSDSWDLDNKYDNQKRTQTSVNTMPQAFPTPGTVTQTIATPLVVNQSQPVVVTPMPTARTLWDNMFKTQPSLFPNK